MMPALCEMPDYCYHPFAGLNIVNQINDYPYPDLGNDYRYVDVVKKVKEYHDRGYPVNGEMYQTIYETAWLMRGLEQTMFDFFENEEVAHAIFENMTLIRIQQVVNFAKAGFLVLIRGIVVSAAAGKKREQVQIENSDENQVSTNKSQFAKGLMVCIISCIFGAMFNFALISGNPIETIAIQHGAAASRFKSNMGDCPWWGIPDYIASCNIPLQHKKEFFIVYCNWHKS